MKTYIKNLLLLPALIAGLGLIPTSQATAQTFTTVHNFTAILPYPGPYNNSEGAHPWGGLILSSNTLYGTARTGGFSSSGSGTIFSVNIDGTGFTNLHNFTAADLGHQGVNDDGAGPNADLVLSGNMLYGTAPAGGNDGVGDGVGTVFAVHTDGSGFTTLHNFGSSTHDGAIPYNAGLVLSGNTLYGTTYIGGTYGEGMVGQGTVFAINTDGTGFIILHTFTGLTDGGWPQSKLVLSGNTLYGTASYGGGESGAGTVFAVNTDGSGFTTLHRFTGYPNEGQEPKALTLSGNTLYGTTLYGGSNGRGTVFKVNTDGTGYTNMHNFAEGAGGVQPWAGLILSGNTLYGTTTGASGVSTYGVVFAINTDGTGFTVLHDVTEANGYALYSRLVLSGNTLFGTAYAGGSMGSGTVFSLSLPPPQLAIASAGTNVILTWPNNVPTPAAGFTLQSTTNLAPAVWSSVFPAPVVVNGQNTVTNPISGPQKFFQLIQ